MSDQERKTFEEAEERPESQEELRDLEPSKEDAEDVKGGIWNPGDGKR